MTSMTSMIYIDDIYLKGFSFHREVVFTLFFDMKFSFFLVGR